MTAAELRGRLVRLARLEHPGRLIRGNEGLAAPVSSPVAAAVLVAFVLTDSPAVLLTKRNERLNRHPGQVSFPGGRVDPGDTDAVAAALREAEEEIALDRRDVEVIGVLGDFLTGTGYRITPVLGLVPPGLHFEPAPDEVEAVFPLSLDVLLDPRAPQRERQERNGVVRDVWVWPHPQHYIWGATAAILVHLAERLRGAG